MSNNICILCGSGNLISKEEYKIKRSITSSKFNIVECKNCSLARLDPIPNENEIAEIYSDYAKKGNRINVEKTRMHSVYISKISRITKLVGSGASILDIGSGLGIFAAMAQKVGFNVKCIEMEKQQSLASSKAFELDVFHGKLEEAVQKDFGKFDIIHFHHVLEHVQNPLEFLLLIRENFTHKDSLVFLEVPNEFSNIVQNLKHKFQGEPEILISRPLQHFTF